ncbi:MAG TPA: RDD family protein [Solirubrobacteraceae bacterium]|nr:RDD family protein [Solirubrobacteraceae bacterium]
MPGSWRPPAGARDPGRERPAAGALSTAASEPGYVGGYTSAPPPGAFGGAAPTATAPYGTGTYELAGWWSRVAAALIDGLIIGVGGLLLMAVVGAVFSVGFFASEEAGVVAVIIGLMLAFAAFAVIALLYAPWMMSGTDGRTLGRMAVGIRVVRGNGRPVTFGWAMLREVAVKWLLFGMVGGSVTFGLGYLLDVLWPLWDEENRALHDFIVDSRVVRG